MKPTNNNPTSQPSAPTGTAPAQPQTTEPQAPPPALYRQYWPFAVIYLLLPLGVVIGIILLLTGDVYRKSQGVFKPISAAEKVALIIIGAALQAYLYMAFQK
jgi:hypothetical protein